MELTPSYIISKGFKEDSPREGTEYPTWSLSIMDVKYYISFLEWRGNYSICIEYLDPIDDTELEKRYSFGVLSTEEDLDSFLSIMAYREEYKLYY